LGEAIIGLLTRIPGDGVCSPSSMNILEISYEGK